ncbi:MAG TPA: transglycosylase domain-containing protein [Longimicrobiales bacterium]|nr:transglycosylase domain-containing protein [Longimicrobiales bacterium]
MSDLAEGAPLPEALRIRDRNGALLAEVGGPLRRSLSSQDIPDGLADAFVAVEDRRFWEHGGVDARGVLRAVLSNVREGEIAEGASTITMQLVRTLWATSLDDVGPWRRKVVEARTAPQLIEELGHERVLTLYLNAIYLGNGIYGVERAALHYFGVGVSDLDVGQIATLVGITRAPEYYDPLRHPERARQIRDVILSTLADAGEITPSTAAEAQAADLGLAVPDSLMASAYQQSHVSAAVVRELRRVAPELGDVRGLDVFTTLDAEVQARGEAVLESQLQAIEEGRYGSFQRIDSAAPLEGAAVALDPATGAVRAWIGGRDFERSEFDRVDQARRQVGSLVKPFLVAAALERGHGIVEPVSADATPIPTDEGVWLPADHVSEGFLPMREALVHSSNRAAAHLGAELGFGSIGRIMRRAGLESPVPALPSTAIGSFGASLLDMAAAYAALGNGGLQVEPHLIDRVETSQGLVIWRRSDDDAPERVMEASTAFVVLDALRDVVSRGTATAVRWSGYEGVAAGKTGTTNEGRDAWFVGLTPELVAGVWIGFDQPRPIVEDGGGGTLAAPVWGSWMQTIDAQTLVARHRGWVPPRGVEHVRYNASSGQVLGDSCGPRTDSLAYHEGWVLAGRYDRRTCAVDSPRWLDSRFRPGLEPGGAEPIRALRLAPGRISTSGN